MTRSRVEPGVGLLWPIVIFAALGIAALLHPRVEHRVSADTAWLDHVREGL